MRNHAWSPMDGRPAQQGMYDPRNEHDACGVGFVATLTGVASHELVEQALTVLRNLEHRGATGSEPDSGDGAKHPLPGPRRLPARRDPLRASRRGFVRRRHRLPARRRHHRGRPHDRDHRPRGGPDGPRLARRPGHPSPARQRRPRHHARVPPGLRRRRRVLRHCPGPQGVRPAQACRARGRGVLPLALRPHPRLQGHAHHRAAGAVLPGPLRPPLRLHGRPGPLPVLHQHLPELAARPPVPLRRAQRRDQHGQGQPQLDEGPRVPARLRALRPGAARPHLPRLHPRRLRLRLLRRGPGAAAPRRALAAARGADDGPRGVGEPRLHGPGPARVLPVPLHDDGALGRPGLRHLHRRRPGRRGPRPQRSAPRPLLGHRRRPRRALLRGRRPRHRPREGRPQGPPPAGPDVPRGHRRAPHHRGRRDQGVPRRRAALPGLAGDRRDRAERPARPRAHRAHPRLGHPPPADLRLHRGRAARHPRPDGPHRTRAPRLHGHRLADRRALRAPPAALRLLHPALRPGHQPAAGRHPRGAGHLAALLARPPGQHPGADRGRLPQRHAAVPGDRQRRARQADTHQRRRRHAGHEGRHPLRPLPGQRRRRRPRRPHRGHLRRGRRGHRGRRPPDRPLRPALRRRARADPLAAAHLRRPPPPHPHQAAHPGGSAGRGRGRPRGPPRRPAHRLRRRRGQPVPRHGVRRGPGPLHLHPGRRRRAGHPEPDLRARQGRPQGHVQDGHLHRRLLPRRPGLRGRRPRRGVRRHVLQRHRHQDRRRPGRHRQGGRRPAHQGVPGLRHRRVPPRAGDRRRVPVAARGRTAPVRPGDRLPPPARHPQPALRHLQAVHGPGERAVRAPDDAPRPLRLHLRPGPDPRRRGRARLRDRQALLHRRHVVRLHLPRGARDARHRDEPARRQVQHRRGRRGPGAPVRPGAPLLDQAGRLRPLRRHQRVPGQRRRHPDQDGPGRQARARAASCPATRSTRGSPRRVTRRPASASSRRRRTTTSTPSKTSRSSSTT